MSHTFTNFIQETPELSAVERAAKVQVDNIAAHLFAIADEAQSAIVRELVQEIIDKIGTEYTYVLALQVFNDLIDDSDPGIDDDGDVVMS